jgi:uncharacterized protein (DUF2141 family)
VSARGALFALSCALLPAAGLAQSAPPPRDAGVAAPQPGPAAKAPPQPLAAPGPSRSAPAPAAPPGPAAKAPPQPAAAQSPPAKAPQPAATKSARGQVFIEILGLRSAKGQLLGAIFHGEKGFPNEARYAIARGALKLTDKRAAMQFDNLPPGQFAFAVVHDENANNKMETGMFGIPTEGYGMSRDAKANFGPPSYSDAKLTLAPGEHKRIVVHMVY